MLCPVELRGRTLGHITFRRATPSFVVTRSFTVAWSFFGHLPHAMYRFRHVALGGHLFSGSGGGTRTTDELPALTAVLTAPMCVSRFAEDPQQRVFAVIHLPASECHREKPLATTRAPLGGHLGKDAAGALGPADEAAPDPLPAADGLHCHDGSSSRHMAVRSSASAIGSISSDGIAASAR